jgi:heme-degrading monooxygenase HmoA
VAVILEHAVITIRPETAEQFEAALARAREVIATAHGFVSLELHRGIEIPDQYTLLIRWEALEDHTVGFRQSDLFVRWRALIGPYFEGPPVVEHWEPVEGLS